MLGVIVLVVVLIVVGTFVRALLKKLVAGAAVSAVAPPRGAPLRPDVPSADRAVARATELRAVLTAALEARETAAIPAPGADLGAIVAAAREAAARARAKPPEPAPRAAAKRHVPIHRDTDAGAFAGPLPSRRALDALPGLMPIDPLAPKSPLAPRNPGRF